MRNRILFFITLFIIWLLLTLSFNAEEMFLGAVFAFITVFAAERIYGKTDTANAKLSKIPWFAVYKLMLFWDILKGAADALYRLILPSEPALPEFISLYSGLKSETALWILADTVTLLAGAVAVNADKDTGIINVYCAMDKTGGCEHALEKSLKKYEKILMKVYE